MRRLLKKADPDFILILVLLVLGLAAYSNSFLASFHFDDITRILENDSLSDFSNLSGVYSYCRERFLTYFTLAINYRISKFDTTSYHIFNFFIHYFATLFLYFLCLEIWKTPAMEGAELKFSLRAPAFLAAGIFLLHPLQTQSVTYIIQRAESMAGMFYLGAILFYVKARLSTSRSATSGYYLLMIFCSLAAAFSKETAVTLPVTILICEKLFFDTSFRNLMQNKMVFFLFVPAGIIVAYKIGMLIQRDFYHDLDIPYTRKQYFLTQFSVLLTYLRLFFWPMHQNLDWDYPVAVTFFHPRTVSSFLLLMMLLVLAVLAYRKYRIFSFGIIGFFITLAPTSSVIPIKDLVYEHRMYLAVGLLAMGCVQVLAQRVEAIKRLPPRSVRMCLLSVILIVLPLLTGLTYARNRVWMTDLSLWRDTVQKSPNKTRPHINYGKALYEHSWGNLEGAKREFEIARRLCPECAMPSHNLALIHWKEGDYEGAVNLYQEAIDRNPDYKEALYQLGRMYKELNRLQEARVCLERVTHLRSSHKFIPAYLDLIEVYVAMELRNEALNIAESLARIPNGLPSLDYYRGVAFCKVQDYTRAKLYFTRQIEGESKRTSANLMLGQIHYLEGSYDQAEEAFRRVLKESVWSPLAHSNLAVVLEKRGQLAGAAEHLEKVLLVEPFSIDASVRLIALYDRLGDSSRRVEVIRKLLRLRPNSKEFAYLEARKDKDLSQTLEGYAETFISSDISSESLKAMAIIATLKEDFETAIARYQRYLEASNSHSQKKRAAKEILRLERLLNGEAMLRTPV